jgi:hypothetical protein
MSVNLVNLIKGQLGDSVLEQLGGLLGESADNTRNAVNAGVPTILGSIADKVANDPGAADRLSSELDGLDSGSAVDFGGLLADSNRGSLAEKGSEMLQGLFGDKLGGITDLISQFSGLGGKSASSLLSMIIPIVLGAINKQKRIHGLDNAGALRLLGDQKDYISQAMPSGMSDLLNSSGLMSGLSDMVSSAGSAVADAASGAADAASEVADSAKDAASTAADSVSEAASSAADKAGDVAGSVADSATQATSAGSSMVKKYLPIAIAVLLILIILKSCM